MDGLNSFIRFLAGDLLIEIIELLKDLSYDFGVILG